MEALLVLQVIVVVFMIIIILMQHSSSDGFTGGSSSGGGLMTGRGQANLLTKLTNILAAIFIINSLLLAYISSHTEREASVEDYITQQEISNEEQIVPTDVQNTADAMADKIKVEDTTPMTAPLTE